MKKAGYLLDINVLSELRRKTLNPASTQEIDLAACQRRGALPGTAGLRACPCRRRLLRPVHARRLVR